VALFMAHLRDVGYTQKIKNENGTTNELTVLNELENFDLLLEDLIQQANLVYDKIIGKNDEEPLITSNDRDDVRPFECNP
jgi:hypothetical protein